MSGQKQKYLHTFSYAELLTTASTLVTLDYSLSPWFSDEIRSSLDPRVTWVRLNDSEEKDGLHKQEKHINPSITKVEPDQRLDGNEPAEDAVAGHYLDHIEVVQQRDNKSSPRRRKRRSKSARKMEDNKEKVSSSIPEATPKTKSPQSSKRRRRSSRSRKPNKPS